MPEYPLFKNVTINFHNLKISPEVLTKNAQAYYNYFMTNILKKLLDYIYKKKCYFCSSSKENLVFCDHCYNKISFLPPNLINTINLCPVYSVSYYNGIIKKLIKGVKYHNQRELALYQAKIMFEYWIKIQNKEKDYIVVPVPLHKKRQKQRKYNHMDLIAMEFAKLANYQFNNTLITRIKDTEPQYKLTKTQREKNLKDAFKINNENLPDKPVLLLDDISTTGSTFQEIIKECKKYGITSLTAFATAIPESNSIYTN